MVYLLCVLFAQFSNIDLISLLAFPYGVGIPSWIDEEKIIQELARNYSQTFLKPRIVNSFRNETFNKEIFREMGKLGLLGPTINGYGCSGTNYVSYGLIAREIERVDSWWKNLQCNFLQVSLYFFMIGVTDVGFTDFDEVTWTALN